MAGAVAGMPVKRKPQVKKSYEISSPVSVAPMKAVGFGKMSKVVRFLFQVTDTVTIKVV